MYSDFVLMVLILDCQAETVNPTQVVIQFDQNTNASINQQDISVIGLIELHSYLNWFFLKLFLSQKSRFHLWI